MIRINYPVETEQLTMFHERYISKITAIQAKNLLADATLKKVTMADGSPLSFVKLLTADFLELFDLSEKMKALPETDRENLAVLKDYSAHQPTIAAFFMEQQDLNMSSCYYCNIDSIYAYDELGDYRDGLDFVRRADYNQLTLIKGIGEVIANDILAARKLLHDRDNRQFANVDECPGTKPVKEKLKDYKFHVKPTHNHFTLDHFYPQADHSLLSLCLYNFIPCCYVCNSKLKKAEKLFLSDASRSSPSSLKFSFPEDARFRVYYLEDGSEVQCLDDFSVDLDIAGDDKDHQAFIRQLKIKGRYLHYKQEAFRLIKRQFDYPDTKLKELSENLGKTIEELKRDLFGDDLFDNAYENRALVKYKRDVAKSIGILK